MKKTVEFDQKCQSCNGTGLYVGLGERDGAAVVCAQCEGTGCFHFRHEYETFQKRIVREDVEHVVEVNPGICIGKAEGKYSLGDFGGMTYNEWRAGKDFCAGSENRLFTCPSWWYQSADYDKKPDWCECNFGGSFANCERFCQKAKCWERFDIEQQMEPVEPLK